jgi:hypothetical protein
MSAKLHRLLLLLDSTPDQNYFCTDSDTAFESVRILDLGFKKLFATSLLEIFVTRTFY